jgi:hypothetical protein
MNEKLIPEMDNPRMEPTAPALTTATTTTYGNTNLPPSARRSKAETNTVSAESSPKRKWYFAGIVAFSLALTGWFGSGGDETKMPNWKYHNEAAQRADHSLKWLGQGGAAGFLTEIAVGRADLDDATTAKVQAALRRNDLQAADRAMQNAQRVAVHANPDPGPGAKPGNRSIVDPESKLKPQLTPQMRQELLRGQARFVQVGLYDSCEEDGDVVEVLVNGAPFCEVPLTRAGAILSVPVSPSAGAVLSIRGSRDGVGGITVGCWTSQGQGFFRVMQPGESESLGVVFP